MRQKALEGFQKRSDIAGINVKGAILAAPWRVERGQDKDRDAVRRDR